MVKLYSTYLKEIMEKNLKGYVPKSEEEITFWKLLKTKSNYFKIHYADNTIYCISFNNNASQEFSVLFKQFQFIEELLNGGTHTTNTKLIADIFNGHTKVKVHSVYGTNEPTYEIGPMDKEYLKHLYSTLSFLDSGSNMSHNINYNNQNIINVHGDNNNINASNNGDINNSVKAAIAKVKEELPPVICNRVEKEIEEYSSTGDPTNLISKLKSISSETIKYAPIITDILLLLQQRN